MLGLRSLELSNQVQLFNFDSLQPALQFAGCLPRFPKFFAALFEFRLMVSLVTVSA